VLCSLVAALCLAGAAFAAASRPHSALRTVNGRLLEVGGPAPAGRPLRGTVLFLRDARTVTRVNTRPNGTFAALLPAGRFQVAGYSRPLHINRQACVGPKAVDIRISARREALITIRCEVH
jgi:hypothetical protein